MKNKAIYKPFHSYLNDELIISNTYHLHYIIDEIDLFEEDEVATLRDKIEAELDETARAAISASWEIIHDLMANEVDKFFLEAVSDLTGKLHYYVFEFPFGDGQALQIPENYVVATCVQHKPDEGDDKVASAIQRAMIMSGKKYAIEFANLKRDYVLNKSEAFIKLKELLESEAIKDKKETFRAGFLKLDHPEKTTMLNLITFMISENKIKLEEHPLFDF